MSATLAAAKAAAEAASNDNTAALVPRNDYAAPATYSAPAKMPSLREAAEASGLVVDGWLSITPDGIKVGADGDIMKDLTVTIDLGAVLVTMNARGEAPGARVLYARTTDGVRDTNGKPWAQALAYVANNSAPDKFVEYNSFELPLKLLAAQGKLAAGKTIGFTPAMMAAKEFNKFIKDLPVERDGTTVTVKLTHSKRKGAQAYGVVEFELLD